MPHRLDWNEYQVLSIVAASPNIRSVRAADRAGMTRAKLSGVVARLHERGLLRRIELDGSRRVDLALTSMGADLCNRTAASVADAERRFMQLPTARRTLGALSRHIGVALASR